MKKPDKKKYFLDKEYIKNIKYLPLAYLETEDSIHKYKKNYNIYNDDQDDTYIYVNNDLLLKDFFIYYKVFGLENIDVEFQKANKKIQIRLRLKQDLSDDKINEIIQLNIDKYNKDMENYNKYQASRLEKMKDRNQKKLDKKIKLLEDQLKKMEQ